MEPKTMYTTPNHRMLSIHKCYVSFLKDFVIVADDTYIGLINLVASKTAPHFEWFVDGTVLTSAEWTFVKDNDWEYLNCISFIKGKCHIQYINTNKSTFVIHINM